MQGKEEYVCKEKSDTTRVFTCVLAYVFFTYLNVNYFPIYSPCVGYPVEPNEAPLNLT